ncbi:MAG TPA: undecaprenyl-phosphate glucose phosphotransferase [Candidatus Krumholzibacteria bacterium]|nr:undecaprenyl-phosphate glucose phosphotransferase [Candidatus Krumholzibacteria bacterium]
MLKTGIGRKRDLLRPTLFLLGDLVALEAAFLCSYVLRFQSGWFAVPLGVPPLGPYLVTSLVLLLIWVGIFYSEGLYDPTRRSSFEEDLAGLGRGVVVGSLVVLALAFFVRQVSYSRTFFGLFFWMSLFFLIVERLFIRTILRRLYSRGVGTLGVLLVGKTSMAKRIEETYQRLPGLGFRILGETDRLEPEAVEAKMLELNADTVVLALSFEDLRAAAEIAQRLGGHHVDVFFVPDMDRLRVSRMRLSEIAGIPFISLRGCGLSGMDRIIKRTFDILSSFLALVLLSPLLLLLAILVKLNSRGPVLYRQDRLGRDNRVFAMLKFRTMRIDAETDSGPVWTVQNDPRRTWTGRVLRRFSLDELPQLWNVLKGDMSMVGPRPERAHFAEEFDRKIPRYLERHRVRSGLTGWAQVNGLRGNTPIEDRTLYDLHYVENWSLGFDLRVLLRTVKSVIKGDNAY